MITDGMNLRMTRGDTESITVSLDEHEFISGDILEFTVRRRPTDETRAMYQKVTTFYEGKAIFNIAPADTSDLAFGEYMYDIQWTDSDGDVKTIVGPARFTIGIEVTYGS